MVHKRSLTEQAVLLFAGHVFALICGLAVPVVLARIFSREEYGLYQQIFLVVMTLLPVGQMGVTQGLYYFLPRERQRRDEIVVQTLIFVLISGAICLITLLAFRFSISQLMNNPTLALYLPVVALLVYFMIASSFLEVLLIAEGKALQSSVVRVLSELGRAATVVAAALTTRGVLSIIVCLACFYFARLVFQWLYIRRHYCLSFRSMNSKSWGQHLSYSIPIGLANVVWLIQMKLHHYFVTFLFSPATYAIYAVGTYNLPVISLITTSVSNVMVPELSRCQKDGDIPRILSVWAGALRKMNLIFFPLFIFLFIMANEFISGLFTERYSGSVSIFRISLFGILVSGINAGAILNAYAQTGYQMRLAVLRLPITIFGVYLLTKFWGLHGAIAADLLLTIGFRFLMIGKVAKIVEVPVVKLLSLHENGKIMAAAVLAGLPVLALSSSFALPPLFMLASCGTVFSVAYCMVGFGLGVTTRSELDAFIRRFFPKVFTDRYTS